jgi:hypothetical protein
MRSRHRRWATGLLVTGAALLATAPPASADIIVEGIKRVAVRLLVRVGRFDDYCEHRRTIDAGDTFESIALRAYGDRARAAEIEAANPALVTTKLPVHGLLLLPPKLVPPVDAKETLAWSFWGYSHRYGCFPLQRVYPDELIDPESPLFDMIAVPAARAADFEKLIEDVKAKNAKADRNNGDEALARAPWAIHVKGLDLDGTAPDPSTAVERRITVRVTEAVATSVGAGGATVPGRVTVERVANELVDGQGNVVKAGFDLLFSWHGIPLGLIAVFGAIGLARLRRTRGGAAAS